MCDDTISEFAESLIARLARDDTQIMSTMPSRRPLRPPAGKADETRKRLVQAARELFSERGYDGATFRAIAARAGLTRPAINHYFSSKQVLYREVVDRTSEQVMAGGVERAQHETTLMGRLTAFIDNAMRANIENPSSLRGQVQGRGVRRRRVILRLDGSGG